MKIIAGKEAKKAPQVADMVMWKLIINALKSFRKRPWFYFLFYNEIFLVTINNAFAF